MSWPWLMLAEVAWVCVVSLWILTDRRAPTATLAWIFALALLPGVGIPVYFFLGPRRLQRRKSRYRGVAVRLAESLGRYQEAVEVPPDILRQVRLAQRLDEAPATSAAELVFHHDGRSAFAAIEKAIEGATDHVHLEFYIWDRDATGTRLRDLLVAKARAGVEVRVLVDGVGARARASFFRPLVEAGGAFDRFNPPRLGLLRSRFVNFRTHRKIVVADGRRGFLGGMNVSDLQTVAGALASPWRDTMLELEGRAVRWLQRAFFENWSFASGDPPAASDRYFPELPVGRHWMQIVRSGPDRRVFPIHEFLFSAITAADERVWVACPYLVPDETIYTALRTAAHRGVDVRLLTSRANDSRLVQAAVRSYYEDWLAAGIRVFEYQPEMLHAKLVVVDHELAVVGSANLDNRSFRLNFEIVAAIYGREGAESVAATLLQDFGRARPITRDDLSRRTWVGRLAQDGARLFSIQL